MNAWRAQVQQQKKALIESQRRSGQTGTSSTAFTSMEHQPAIDNPYLHEAHEADELEEEPYGSQTALYGDQSSFTMSRNTSSNSLRANAVQMSSSIASIDRNTGRPPPSRFPLPDPAVGMHPSLSLNTNVPPPAVSPAEFAGASYFSPTADSPLSTRSSSQASGYFGNRVPTPGQPWSSENGKHRTAPATSRAATQHTSGSTNGYIIDGRSTQGPTSTYVPVSQQGTVPPMPQSRMRSTSTPDIYNINGVSRRYAHPQMPPSDTVPVPPIPPQVATMRVPINRSQTSSPTENPLPIRSATRSPTYQRDRTPRPPQDVNGYERPQQRNLTVEQPASRNVNGSQMRIANEHSLASADGMGLPLPPQLKVKVSFEPSGHVTIVVPSVIKHRSLIDRVDAKMSKVSSVSIGKGQAKLRYKDQDGDIITIKSDEDVQLAIEDWAATNLTPANDAPPADFELFWSEKKNREE